MSTGPDAENDAYEAGQNVAAQGGIVSAMTMLSRISGLARDMVLSYFFGATNVADAFFVAFRIPNFFRRLFAEGAFSAAFVPLFARKLEGGGKGEERGEGRAEAEAFAVSAFAVLFWALGAVVIAAEIAMPWTALVGTGGPT